ncbi:MAG: hypothetical protein ACI4V3_08955 [Faecousia sp.]
MRKEKGDAFGGRSEWFEKGQLEAAWAGCAFCAGRLQHGRENIRQQRSGTLQIHSRMKEDTTAVVTMPKGGRDLCES